MTKLLIADFLISLLGAKDNSVNRAATMMNTNDDDLKFETKLYSEINRHLK